jgi:penicillin-binding protein 2
MSCNPYFYKVTQRIINQRESSNTFKDTEIGLEVWARYMKSFGFGVKLETDIPSIKSGYIPDVPFYNRYHGEGRWAYSTIYSIAIGQGEVLVIPLQLANFASILANRGYFVTPHFIKGITKIGNIDRHYRKRNYTLVDSVHFVPVVDAMQRAVEPGGTGTAAQVKDIIVCGKTGTAQNPHGEDHSVFIAFAPKDNPKIAIIVYVENGGWGGTVAAPIAGMMIEKYLNGSVKDSARAGKMSRMNLLDRNVMRTHTGGLKKHQKSKKHK